MLNECITSTSTSCMPNVASTTAMFTEVTDFFTDTVFDFLPEVLGVFALLLLAGWAIAVIRRKIHGRKV